jgi:hypothetical protein
MKQPVYQHNDRVYNHPGTDYKHIERYQRRFQEEADVWTPFKPQDSVIK